MQTAKISQYIYLFFLVLIAVIFFRQVRYAVVLIPLAGFIACLMFFHPARDHYVRITRDLDRERMLAGEEIKVTLTVENLSYDTVDFLEIRDEIPPASRVSSGTNYWVVNLNPLETLDLTYYLTCSERGRYSIGPVQLRSQNLFGTYLYQEEVPEETTFAVVPKLHHLQKSFFNPRRMKMFAGPVRSRDLGHETDFYGLRDYTGDDIRRINWKKSARYEKFLVNEFYMQKTVDLEIILDATHTTTATLDGSISALMTLVDYFAVLRTKVGFWKLGDPVTRINPAYGKRQLLKISDNVINLQPEPIKNPEVFYRRCKVLLRSVPRSSVFIIISPFKFNAVTKFARILSDGGYEVFAIVPISYTKEQLLATGQKYIKNAQIIDLLTKEFMAFDEMAIRKSIPPKVTPMFWDTQTPLRELIFPRAANLPRY
ncbi:MAG: DUF58 domain-containing protein [Candidatus Odinarchaeota archaeon]